MTDRVIGQVETWADVTQAFELLDEELVYVDQPLQGYLRSREDGRLFAFRADIVVPDLVWHWTLIPKAAEACSVDECFSLAQRRPPAVWISVLEDRRSGPPLLRAVWLDGSRRAMPTRARRP